MSVVESHLQREYSETWNEEHDSKNVGNASIWRVLEVEQLQGLDSKVSGPNCKMKKGDESEKCLGNKKTWWLKRK